MNRTGLEITLAGRELEAANRSISRDIFRSFISTGNPARHEPDGADIASTRHFALVLRQDQRLAEWKV
jgi:hypothetical protein